MWNDIRRTAGGVRFKHNRKRNTNLRRIVPPRRLSTPGERGARLPQPHPAGGTSLGTSSGVCRGIMLGRSQGSRSGVGSGMLTTTSGAGASEGVGRTDYVRFKNLDRVLRHQPSLRTCVARGEMRSPTLLFRNEPPPDGRPPNTTRLRGTDVSPFWAPQTSNGGQRPRTRSKIDPNRA
jgi:hypothetical protein